MVQKACPLLLRKPSSFTCSAPLLCANAAVLVKKAIAKPRNRILMFGYIGLMMKDRDREMNKEGPCRSLLPNQKKSFGDLVLVVVDYSHTYVLEGVHLLEDLVDACNVASPRDHLLGRDLARLKHLQHGGIVRSLHPKGSNDL